MSSGRTNLPRSYLLLALAQLLLSGLALGLALADACGICGGASVERIAIGAMGCVGYATLALLGFARRPAAFFAGVFASAGAHLALSAVMVVSRSFCPLCAVAAAIAILWSIHAARLLGGRGWIPASIALTGLTLAVLWGNASASRPHHPGAPLSVVVYENPDCPHCQEFRRTHAPRLREEFGERVSLEFRPARGVAGVRWTPTVAIEGGDLHEGIASYESLAAGVRKALCRRNGKNPAVQLSLRRNRC